MNPRFLFGVLVIILGVLLYSCKPEPPEQQAQVSQFTGDTIVYDTAYGISAVVVSPFLPDSISITIDVPKRLSFSSFETLTHVTKEVIKDSIVSGKIVHREINYFVKYPSIADGKWIPVHADRIIVYSRKL